MSVCRSRPERPPGIQDRNDSGCHTSNRAQMFQVSHEASEFTYPAPLLPDPVHQMFLEVVYGPADDCSDDIRKGPQSLRRCAWRRVRLPIYYR